METGHKPGGGNHPQLYIKNGCGEKNGEYTNQNYGNSVVGKLTRIRRTNCRIINKRYRYNFYKSRLVKGKPKTYIIGTEVSLRRVNSCNSVVKKIKNGHVVCERYYNEKGEAYLDIDYTCHGNPKWHTEVPHIHRWVKDENGNLKRGDWEVFR